MFGQRDKRVARRQRALEELLWLDPVERERRIIAAVAARDFTADEVESTLRLIARLDSLRGMDLPGGGRLIGTLGSKHAAGTSSDDVELGLVDQAPEDEGGDDPEGELVGIPIVPEPVEVSIRPEYVGVPIVSERPSEPDAGRTLDAEMPLDALESAEIWEERPQATLAPAIARRAAETSGEWEFPVEGGQLPPSEDVGPSIAWLRPN